MIRKIISVALLAGLAACSTPGSQHSASTAPDTSTGGSAAPAYSTGTSMDDDRGNPQVCDSQRVQNMVGQAFSDSTAQAAREGSGSKSIRMLKPGQVMTMEYNASRLNIILNANGAIDALRCG